MQRIPMTVNGANALRRELEKLTTEDRPNIARAIGEARAMGDLKENAEYHAAKENQGIIEARIRDIEGKLANANIIDVTKLPQNGVVVFGTTVEVVDENNQRQRFQLVGDDEANVEAGKISINSPIARALVGKKIGDIATPQTPRGTLELEILSVEYLA